MQARYIAAVYSGRVCLPHPEEQELDGFYAVRQHRNVVLDAELSHPVGWARVQKGVLELRAGVDLASFCRSEVNCLCSLTVL